MRRHRMLFALVALALLAAACEYRPLRHHPTTELIEAPATTSVKPSQSENVATEGLTQDQPSIPAPSPGAGTLSTLAGGDKGYADGTGSAARFAFPVGIAVDSNGNVFV